MALGVAVAAVLGGCASTTSTRRAHVGDPIPEGPRYRRLPARPHPSPLPPPAAGATTHAGAPTIIRREVWASYGPNMRLANRMGRVNAITVHHDAMVFESTLFDDTARRLESIRRGHVGHHWADIGYHFAVDPAGRIWEARPEDIQGAHVRDRNEHNLGIVVLGNFEKQRPTEASLRALDSIVVSKMDQYRVPVDRIYTHRELAATACPGRHLQSYMQLARGRGGAILTA